MPAQPQAAHDRPMPGLPQMFPRCSGSRGTAPYGLRQEERMRRALRHDERLEVRYSRELDAIYKLDAVVLDRTNPLLPAVGVQFTTRHDPEKRRSTIAAVRRTRVVPRLLYLEAERPLGPPAYPLLLNLVRHIARLPVDRGIVSAILTRDGNHRYCLRQVRAEPAGETESTRKPQ